MLENPVEFSFILKTIAILIGLTVVGIIFVKMKKVKE
jgi:hypothetical protein